MSKAKWLNCAYEKKKRISTAVYLDEESRMKLKELAEYYDTSNTSIIRKAIRLLYKESMKDESN